MKTRKPLSLIALCMSFVCASVIFAAAATEGSFQRTLQVTGPVNLEIETGSGNISVRTGGSGQVQVTGRIKATNWFGGDAEAKVRRIEANPPIQQSGNDIRLGHITEPELRRNISLSFEVVVPPDTRLRSHSGSGNEMIDGVQGTVTAESGSGNLTITNIGDTVRASTGSGNVEIAHVKGNVRAQTGSGDVRATDIAGGLEGETGSGDIVLEQTASGAVRAQTGSGGIDVRGVRGSLQATTGSGSIRADGIPTGAWNAQTGSGPVRLKFPPDASFDLHAHTSSGSISVNHPLTVQGAVGKKEVRGKVRSGGVPVEVETGSGSIQID
jgi:DUF4097 and DUF4098 domain-containing protein YvlB